MGGGPELGIDIAEALGVENLGDFVVGNLGYVYAEIIRVNIIIASLGSAENKMVSYAFALRGILRDMALYIKNGFTVINGDVFTFKAGVGTWFVYNKHHNVVLGEIFVRKRSAGYRESCAEEEISFVAVKVLLNLGIGAELYKVWQLLGVFR